MQCLTAKLTILNIRGGIYKKLQKQHILKQ